MNKLLLFSTILLFSSFYNSAMLLQRSSAFKNIITSSNSKQTKSHKITKTNCYKKYCDSNDESSDKMALHKAIINNETNNKIEELVKSGKYNLEQKNKLHQKPLNLALKLDRYDIALTLLNNGAIPVNRYYEYEMPNQEAFFLASWSFIFSFIIAGEIAESYTSFFLFSSAVPMSIYLYYHCKHNLSKRIKYYKKSNELFCKKAELSKKIMESNRRKKSTTSLD